VNTSSVENRIIGLILPVGAIIHPAAIGALSRIARSRISSLAGEKIKPMSSAVYLQTVGQDIAFALRAMRKNSVFAITAVFTLALGIGGNTAIFTVIRAVLLKELRYRDAGRIVRVSADYDESNDKDEALSLVRLEYLRKCASFNPLGSFLNSSRETLTLTGDGEPEALKGARVSANFLEILGVRPVLGRSFLPSEDVPGGPAVAMISAELWQRRFSRDPQIDQRVVRLNSTVYTVVGVLPAGFAFPYPGADVWVPRPAEWSWLPSRYWNTVTTLIGFARLSPGANLVKAQAEMQVLNHEYEASHPGEPAAKVRLTVLKDRLTANVRPTLWMLFGATGFVLLISCANVANLLMSRATSRQREFGVRAALGAGRGRLIRQMLVESLVLVAIGGACGALVAGWILGAFGYFRDLGLPRAGEIRLDGAVLGFTVFISLLTGIVFGLVPAMRMSRPELADMLRTDGATRGIGSNSRAIGLNARSLIVVGQVALSVVLLIGAALLIESLARLRNVVTGFEPSGLLTARISLPTIRYDTDEKKALFFQRVVERVEALPGARAVGVGMSLPTTSWLRTSPVMIQGQPPLDPVKSQTSVQVQSVTPGYFSAMEIQVRRGREFTARDNTVGALPVVVINEKLARHFWPDYPAGQNPVGKHLWEAADKAAGWLEIVGVVADVHEGGLGFDATPELYVPTVVHTPQAAYLVVRTGGNPLRLAESIRRAVFAVDPAQPLTDIKTMNAVFEASIGNRRLTMQLLGLFAGVALLLALVGIYGVTAYSVAQRTRELGIRRALGAQQSDLLGLVLKQVLVLTMIGAVVGVAGALALTRVMNALLFGITATDPATFLGIVSFFMVASLTASLIPAWRAGSLDPMAALRTG
jgi:predicted permease